jgi:hypothetical protein
MLLRCRRVQVRKTSGRPHRLARLSEKARERWRRNEKQDGNRLARPSSCRFCSPCCIWHLWPPHISVRLNVIASDPARSGGSSRSGRAVRSKGRHGEVVALQAASQAEERAAAAPDRERWWREPSTNSTGQTYVRWQKVIGLFLG